MIPLPNSMARGILPVGLLSLLTLVAASPFANPVPASGTSPKDILCPLASTETNTNVCLRADGDNLLRAPTLLYPRANFPDSNKFRSLQDLANRGNKDLPSCSNPNSGTVLTSRQVQDPKKCNPEYPKDWGFTYTSPGSGLTLELGFNASDTCPYSVVQGYQSLTGETKDTTLIDVWREFQSVGNDLFAAKLKKDLEKFIGDAAGIWSDLFNGEDMYEAMGDKDASSAKEKRSGRGRNPAIPGRLADSTVAATVAQAGNLKLVLFGYILGVGAVHGVANGVFQAYFDSEKYPVWGYAIQEALTLFVLTAALLLGKLEQSTLGQQYLNSVALWAAAIVLYPLIPIINLVKNTAKLFKSLGSSSQVQPDYVGWRDLPWGLYYEPGTIAEAQEGDQPANKAYVKSQLDEVERRINERLDRLCPAQPRDIETGIQEVHQD